jgi:nucleotide-binding universal stress UspA family protein
MFPFRRVLVALAATETDAGLLDYAAMIGARSSTVQFLCVHVAPTPQALESALPLRELAHHRLNTVTCKFVHGEREDRLLEIAAEHQADVILLGHRRDRSGRRSLARRLAMKAPCTIWLAPEGTPPRLRRILAPIDFSRRSADAVILAAQLAEFMGLEEAHALHVYFNHASTTYDEYRGHIAEEHELAFRLFVAPIDLHGVDLKPLFVEGSIVAHTVLRVAEELECDLIVMGTRGRSRSAAVLLGSETEHAIRETRIPILAVKHFGSRLRFLQALLDRGLRTRPDDRFT